MDNCFKLRNTGFVELRSQKVITSKFCNNTGLPSTADAGTDALQPSAEVLGREDILTLMA